MRSLLPVVLAADNFPLHSGNYPTRSPDGTERYVPFHLTFQDFQAGLAPIGLLRPQVLAELLADEREEGECPWQFYSSAKPAAFEADDGVTGNKRQRVVSETENQDGELEMDLDLEVQCVFFADWVVSKGGQEMGRVMQSQAEKWRSANKFCGPIAGWRNEQYQIYADARSSAFLSSSSTTSVPSASSGSSRKSNAIFTLERSACAVFGLATYGVHGTAYEGEGEDMKIWVPRRSATKPTFPSMLDNSVAGGIPAGMDPWESMIKECDEEASLPDAFVRKRMKSAGVITYFYITPDGYLQPELEYIYDIPLPPQSSPEYIRPKPHDDEVESFSLLTVPETLAAMYAGEFKPNCGSVLVDFMIRHGMVTPENEPHYLEIRWRLARRLGVSTAGGGR